MSEEPKCYATKEYNINSYICKACRVKDKCSQFKDIFRLPKRPKRKRKDELEYI